MNRLNAFLLAAILAAALSAADEPTSDKFELLKQEYASAKMVDLGVDIIITSDVFDDVDTSMGRISITDDGRYSAKIEDDIYLFDGQCIWEYSAENNQATKKCLKKDEKFESWLIFIKNLDRYYATSVIKPDEIYRLTGLGDTENDLPDSLTIFMSTYGLQAIEYYDLNGDLNRIRIVYGATMDVVVDELFEINLPDSVEIISLP
jgi:outer membrane lipoprotein-sorting protein